MSVPVILWNGAKPLDQVIRCGDCGIVTYVVERGVLRAVGTGRHHGERHPREVYLVPIDNLGATALNK